MNFNDISKTAILDELKQVDILHFADYVRKNRDKMLFYYTNGMIDDASIEDSLETAVIDRARVQYEQLITKKERYPDHVGNPECLAYALQNGNFSEREIRNIPFDHGENAETFPLGYSVDSLLSDLRLELLNPKSPSHVFDLEYDPHPICLCHD